MSRTTSEYPQELLGEMAAVHSGKGPLTYNGYEVTKKVLLEKLPSGHSNEIEYAAISRRGRQTVSLKGFTETGAGAYLRLGLFPVLGGETKQLVVEQTVHRGWRYWVIDLSDDLRVVFDNGDYPVGHNLRAVDLDGDGRLELIQLLHNFWFFNSKINNVNSPFINVVFKYDPQAQEYVPANHEFQDFALRDVKEGIDKARQEREKLNNGGYDGDLLGAVLEVALSYLYAGREEEGWTFYEQYDLPDKEEIKREVEKALAEDTVYQSILKRSRK